MGKTKKYNPHPVGNPQIQIGAMKSLYPNFKVKKLVNGNLLFTGTIQPKEYMREYTVTIECRGELTPHVKVISPKLVDKPPHFYREQKRLCLYKPVNFHWMDTRLIANYIVPWTSAWLYFYEIWLQKGKWLGPEALHDNNLDKL